MSFETPEEQYHPLALWHIIHKGEGLFVEASLDGIDCILMTEDVFPAESNTLGHLVLDTDAARRNILLLEAADELGVPLEEIDKIEGISEEDPFLSPEQYASFQEELQQFTHNSSGYDIDAALDDMLEDGEKLTAYHWFYAVFTFESFEQTQQVWRNVYTHIYQPKNPPFPREPLGRGGSFFVPPERVFQALDLLWTVPKRTGDIKTQSFYPGMYQISHRLQQGTVYADRVVKEMEDHEAHTKLAAIFGEDTRPPPPNAKYLTNTGAIVARRITHHNDDSTPSLDEIEAEFRGRKANLDKPPPDIYTLPPGCITLDGLSTSGQPYVK